MAISIRKKVKMQRSFPKVDKTNYTCRGINKMCRNITPQWIRSLKVNDSQLTLLFSAGNFAQFLSSAILSLGPFFSTPPNRYTERFILNVCCVGMFYFRYPRCSTLCITWLSFRANNKLSSIALCQFTNLRHFLAFFPPNYLPIP